jgi:hypothetical protein
MFHCVVLYRFTRDHDVTSNKTVYSGHRIVFRDINGGGTNVFEETTTDWAGYVFVPCQKI